MKTSEELAEEYCKKYWDAHPETFVDGYNAGYKAAQEHADSCEHILDMSKMVDVNGWVSVKDRLPNANQGWVTVYGANWGFRWMVQPGFYDVETKEWLSRFIKNDEEEYCALEAVTHWQPLPEPPKEEE